MNSPCLLVVYDGYFLVKTPRKVPSSFVAGSWFIEVDSPAIVRFLEVDSFVDSPSMVNSDCGWLRNPAAVDRW